MKKTKESFKKCPTCLGAGKVKVVGSWPRYTPEVRDRARKLFRDGMSLRKIGKEIGVDHPQKVYSLIISKL